MAGDWIKVSSDICSKREVIVGARFMGRDRFSYVGLCIAFWTWADAQTVDGFLHGLTCEDVDAVIDAPGFGESLKYVGWLLEDDHGLTVPNFERHNGRSGKRRATDNARKREARSTKCQNA
tara:strand:- start:64 stop:426 length:363 start_codon:yes stop_codon:yes gene_type:complete